MGITIFLLNRLFILIDGSYMVESVLTIVNIVIGVIVYGVTLLLTGGVTKGDLKDMSPRLYKMVPSGIRQKMKS